MPEQDSEQQYPQKPTRRANGKSQPGRPREDEEIIIRPRNSQRMSEDITPRSQAPLPPEEEEEDDENQSSLPPLPANGLLYALIAGLIAGILTILLNIAFTFLNAGTFQEAAREITTNKLSTSVAYIIAALSCFNLLISVAVALAVGYVIGKMAVQRRLGFYAGAIVGLLVYLGSFLVRYIPNYPGNLPASSGGATGAATGIFVSLIFLCIWGLIGGLLGYLGARIATRRHSYYTETAE